MSNLNTSHLTNEEIKEKIKALIEKERADKVEHDRWVYLRKEVEVQKEWDQWCHNDIHRQNVKRWLEEWAFNDYGKYLRMIEERSIPPVYVQMENNPDDYEQFYSDLWSAFRYRTKEEAKEEEKSSRIAWGIIIGVPTVVAVAIVVALRLIAS